MARAPLFKQWDSLTLFKLRAQFKQGRSLRLVLDKEIFLPTRGGAGTIATWPPVGWAIAIIGNYWAIVDHYWPYLTNIC